MLSFLRRMQTPVLLGLTVFWVGAASAPTFGVAQSNPAAQEAIATYPVRGVVLNSLTHQPIARALVDANSNAVLTDGEGQFELNLPEGLAQISVRRPGYSTRGQDVMHLVNVGAGMPELTFDLTPLSGIHGHVALASGEDAEAISIVSYRQVNVDGRERWMSGDTVTTDSEGNFHLQNLDSPAAWVLCTAPSRDSNGAFSFGSRAGQTAAAGYAPICYPGPLPPAVGEVPANAIQLAPGQQAEADLTLTRQPFYRVSITVANASPTSGVNIRIHDSAGRTLQFGPRWRAEVGIAEVYLPTGRYYAEATAQETPLRYGRVDFQVLHAPVAGLNLSLLPLHPIPVEIRKEFAAARPSDAGVVTDNELVQPATGPGINITLSSADSAMVDVAGALSPRKGSNDPSQFELVYAAPGRYWVDVNAYEGYISSITSGGVDLTREPLVIGPGNTAAPIQVTLRNDGGQISCTVNRPAASTETPQSASGQNLGEIRLYYIYAIPLSRTPSQIPQIQGQSQDTLQIPNVPPGTYRVVAFDKMQTFDLADPKEFARMTRFGQTVTVSAGATVPVQLDLVHLDGPGAESESDAGSVDL